MIVVKVKNELTLCSHVIQTLFIHHITVFLPMDKISGIRTNGRRTYISDPLSDSSSSRQIQPFSPSPDTKQERIFYSAPGQRLDYIRYISRIKENN